MAIELTQDERNYLKQFVQRKMEPTRRQKAIALLDLADGKTPAEAARCAGIPKDEVNAMAFRFSEHGLPGIGFGANSKIQVELIRPGVRARKYRLTKGDTVADLLSRSKISTTNRIVLIDNVEAVESSPLHEGAVVLIAPRATNGPQQDSSRPKIASLQDDAIFQQYREILKARRKLRAQQESAG